MMYSHNLVFDISIKHQDALEVIATGMAWVSIGVHVLSRTFLYQSVGYFLFEFPMTCK